MRIKFVPADEVPARYHKSARATGPARNRRATVDRKFADALTKRPGEWAIYPLKAYYPDSDLRKRDEFQRLARSVRSRVSGGAGAFTKPEGKRFTVRVDSSTSRIYVALVDE